MEQVAHQTIVMQFILELAKSLKVDPRGCFRQFFEKIKVIVWLENYHSFKVQMESNQALVEKGEGSKPGNPLHDSCSHETPNIPWFIQMAYG